MGGTVGALRREQLESLEWRRRKMNASICVKYPPIVEYVKKQIIIIDDR